MTVETVTRPTRTTRITVEAAAVAVPEVSRKRVTMAAGATTFVTRGGNDRAAVPVDKAVARTAPDRDSPVTHQASDQVAAAVEAPTKRVTPDSTVAVTER
jgi:hypothetical protein